MDSTSPPHHLRARLRPGRSTHAGRRRVAWLTAFLLTGWLMAPTADAATLTRDLDSVQPIVRQSYEAQPATGGSAPAIVPAPTRPDEWADRNRAIPDTAPTGGQAVLGQLVGVQADSAARAVRAEANAAWEAMAAAAPPPTTAPPVAAAPPTTVAPPAAAAPPVAAPLVAPPATGGGFIWPINGRVSQEFRGGHGGMDIYAPSGTPVFAAQGGTVTKAQFDGGGFGNLVVIDHGNGLTTAYAHLSRILTSVGQTVSQGQQIGLEGSTGRSSGPHLHFETRVNGVARNPRSYLP